MSKVSIQGLDPAEVFATLFNAAKPIALWAEDTKPMTKEEAQQIVGSQSFIGYWRGRNLGFLFVGDQLDIGVYNREHGFGSAELVIEELREHGFRVHSLPVQSEIEDDEVVNAPHSAVAIKLRRAGLL